MHRLPFALPSPKDPFAPLRGRRYNDADLYVLDDVLSALDAHVGKHVFENCIGELRSRGKTVLMATNQLHVLPRSDLVILVKNDAEAREGWLSNVGSFEQLMADTDFAKLMEEVGISEADFQPSLPDPAAEMVSHGLQLLQPLWTVPTAAISHPSPAAQMKTEEPEAEGAEAAAGDSMYAEGKAAEKGSAAGGKEDTLTEAEERNQGEVAWGVYGGEAERDEHTAVPPCASAAILPQRLNAVCVAACPGYIKMAKAQWFFGFTVLFTTGRRPTAATPAGYSLLPCPAAAAG